MITQEYLKSILHYDPDTGIFTWRNDRVKGIKAGDIAGGLNGKGYVRIWILGKKYMAHRLAWLYITGKWPNEETDHKNRIRNDNRFTNLREATKNQNQHNASKRRDNKTGVKGVSYQKKENNFKAQIQTNGEGIYLGCYATLKEAATAYRNASIELHGEYRCAE